MTDEPGLREMLRETLAALTDVYPLIPEGDDWRRSVENTMVAARVALAATPAASDGSLDVAWGEAIEALPPNYGLSVAADGPGYVARASGPREIVFAAWSVDDRELVPDPDTPATPAKALRKLAAILRTPMTPTLSESPSEGKTE